MTKPRAWLFLWFIILSGNLLCAQEKDDYYHEEIKEILSAHSKTGMGVMNLLDTLPQKFKIGSTTLTKGGNKNWSRYIRNPYDIASRLSTTVHETFHSVEGRLSYHLIVQNHTETFRWGDKYNSYFIDAERPMLVKRTVLYNSNELKDLIPEELREFRYKLYIADSGNLSSQVHGIYGLMEEWNAYYLGNRTGVDLYAYYLERAKKKPGDMLKYVSQVGGSYFAYYEFKYFILKYLENARENHREVYEAMMANSELRRAFTEIDTAFASLIEEFMQSLAQIETDLATFTDEKVRMRPGILFIGSGGTGFFQKEADQFKEALNDDALKEIEAAFKYRVPDR